MPAGELDGSAAIAAGLEHGPNPIDSQKRRGMHWIERGRN
jgi:hypothetical protein